MYDDGPLSTRQQLDALKLERERAKLIADQAKAQQAVNKVEVPKPNSYVGSIPPTVQNVSDPFQQWKNATMGAESTYGNNPDTWNKNSSGALGLYQLTESTFNGLKKNKSIPQDYEFTNPVHNTKASEKLAEEVWARSGGDPKKASAIWYSGPKAIDKKTGEIKAYKDPKNPGNPNTIEYVDRVTSILEKGQSKTSTPSTSGMSINNSGMTPRQMEGVVTPSTFPITPYSDDSNLQIPQPFDQRLTTLNNTVPVITNQDIPGVDRTSTYDEIPQYPPMQDLNPIRSRIESVDTDPRRTDLPEMYNAPLDGVPTPNKLTAQEMEAAVVKPDLSIVPRVEDPRSGTTDPISRFKTPDPRQPSIYASKEEWEAYRKLKETENAAIERGLFANTDPRRVDLKTEVSEEPPKPETETAAPSEAEEADFQRRLAAMNENVPMAGEEDLPGSGNPNFEKLGSQANQKRNDIENAVKQSRDKEDPKGWLANALTGIFGGKDSLFTDKELIKFAILAAGGLLTGGSLGGSLKYAGLYALQSADKREVAQAAENKELKKKLIDQGYSMEAIDKYFGSGRTEDLGEPKTILTYKTTGEQMTIDRGPDSGKVYQVREATHTTGKRKGDVDKVVMVNGKPIPLDTFQRTYQSRGLNVVPYSASEHSPAAVSKRFDSLLGRAGEIAEETLKGKLGSSDDRGKPNPQRIGLPGSKTIANQSASYFKAIGFNPDNSDDAREINTLMESAVNDMIADKQNRNLKEVRSIEPYLANNIIKFRTGLNPDMLRVNETTMVPPEKIVALHDLGKQVSFRLNDGKISEPQVQKLLQQIATKYNADPEIGKKYKASKDETKFYQYAKDFLSDMLKQSEEK